MSNEDLYIKQAKTITHLFIIKSNCNLLSGTYVNKGNSSIPLFKTHKSMDKKQNRGNKLKLRETH